MKEKLLSLFENRKVMILGFGREGLSTYHFIRNHFPELPVVIADQRIEIKQEEFLQKDANVEFRLGKNYLFDMSGVDMIIKAPGISLKDFPALKEDPRLTSQTTLFLFVYSSQTIGITGTKGKSTTSSLIYYILKSYFKDVLLVGNIGVPPFDMINDISENTKVVFELSSHQLENIKIAPQISVLLNIFEEHLDHYNSYDAYQQAKFNITRFQSENDYFVYCDDNAIVKSLYENAGFKRKAFSFSGSTAQHVPANLKGEHNQLNIAAAIIVAKILKIPENNYLKAIAEFKALPHRLEFLGKYKAVEYYDDSISTIPEATIAAVKAIPNVSTLILGGFDRGINYDILGKFLQERNINNLVFIGNAGQRIYDAIKKFGDCQSELHFATTFEDAVQSAVKQSVFGGAVLLSPAAASYDMFKNFEVRGDEFKRLVLLNNGIVSNK